MIEPAEDNFNYIEDALRTKSDKFYGDRIALIELDAVLENSVDALQVLDAVKKTLFYGKPYMGKTQTFNPSCENLAYGMTLPEVAGEPAVMTQAQTQDIIHAIIGKATEAGELLELLLKTIRGEKFDIVNFKEEIGDGQWYDAIGCAAVGATFVQMQHTNIDKLKTRFPDKFTEQNANVRNLTHERKVLNKTFD